MVMRPQTETMASARLAAKSGTKMQRLHPELHSILPLNSVEEVAVPEVQPILVQQLEEHSGNQQCNQQPGVPRRRVPPESGGAFPKARDETPLIRGQVGPIQHAQFASH